MIDKYRILFMRELPSLVSPLKKLTSVILSQGSTPRDLNLLFLFESSPFPAGQLQDITTQLQNEIIQQFGNKIRINASPKILPDLDKYFLGQLLREGHVVYGAPPTSQSDLNPATIITYKLSDKTQQEKTRLNYKLYGRKLKKGRATKTIQGLLQSLGGSQLGSGAIIVPDASKPEITNLLKTQNITYSEKRIWTNAEERA